MSSLALVYGLSSGGPSMRLNLGGPRGRTESVARDRHGGAGTGCVTGVMTVTPGLQAFVAPS